MIMGPSGRITNATKKHLLTLPSTSSASRTPTKQIQTTYGRLFCMVGMTLFADAFKIQNTSRRRSCRGASSQHHTLIGWRAQFQSFSHLAKLFGIHAAINLEVFALLLLSTLEVDGCHFKSCGRFLLSSRLSFCLCVFCPLLMSSETCSTPFDLINRNSSLFISSTN